MGRTRTITIAVAGTLALAGTALAAGPAAAADEAPPAAASPNLELVAGWGDPDPRGLQVLMLEVRNVGGQVAERPWLRVGFPELPASAWQPACREVQTAPALTATGPVIWGPQREAATRCRIDPLQPGASQLVRITVPRPASPAPPSPAGTGRYFFSAAGDDGVPLNAVRGVASLPAPPAVTVTVPRRQQPSKGIRVVLEALRAGTAQLNVMVRAATGRSFALRKTVHIAKPGTRTVLVTGDRQTRHLLLYAVGGEPADASVSLQYRTRDGWGPTNADVKGTFTARR